MTMDIFQGTPGSGKSASVIVDLLEWLRAGGVVAANFRLVPDWAMILASKNWRVRCGLLDQSEVAHDLWRRYMVVGSAPSLWSVSSTLIPRCKPPISHRYEGRGRLYLDEAQLYFNSRDWNKNTDFIHFFSQHRKLKWDVILVAHSSAMIDKQIRFFCDYETRFRNLQKVKIPILQIPASPFPVFLGISRYAGVAAGAGEIVKRSLYPLHKWASGLYDSAAVFSSELDVAASHCGPDPLGPVHSAFPDHVPDENLLPFFDEIKKRWGVKSHA